MMNWRVPGALLLLLACAAAPADVYVLGSSYSEDAIPSALDDNPRWHIDCGKPLQFIFDNPQAPCITTSSLWPAALTATQFAYISFQPVAGSGITEQSDIADISYWMALQPHATVVIHGTWPLPSSWETTFHDPAPDNPITNYSRSYYYDLIGKLQAANPGRVIVSDRAGEVLDRINHDIQRGIAPLSGFQQLFRDAAGHSSENFGKYLQHNVLRQAFGQRIGVDSTTPGVAPAIQAYINAKIAACPPRSTLADALGDLCDPPLVLANPDSANIVSEVETPLDVTGNDIGFIDPVAVSLVSTPGHGTVALTGSPGASSGIQVWYTSDTGYTGPDSFRYIVSDSFHASPPVLVSIQVGLDSDNDGVPDSVDNCIYVYNPDQADADGDGYGNACDGDLNNDGIVNFQDMALFRTHFGKPDPVADFYGDGIVNFQDLAIFRQMFGKPPGPSGFHQ